MRVTTRTQLTQWARQSPHLWLFLDYDGTLADFAPTPDDVDPDPQIIDLLGRLAGKAGLRLTILSGRRLEHMRRLLPIPGIFVAGIYGIELLTPNGGIIQRVELTNIRPVLDTIRPQWMQLIHARQGFYLEDKDWSLALHARFASDQEAIQILQLARGVIDRIAPAGRFRVLDGHKFLEVAPWQASKRETVMYLLDHYPLPDAHLLYIGDDDKDEEAFPVIHDHQGVAIKVRQPSQASRRTDADLVLETPADALHWLEGLLGSQPGQL